MNDNYPYWKIHCPNCHALMDEGDPCPECEHTDRGDCQCQFCTEDKDDA